MTSLLQPKSTQAQNTAEISVTGMAPLIIYLKEIGFQQRRKNSGRQVAWAAEFCTVTPNVCGSSLLNLFYATLLTPDF